MPDDFLSIHPETSIGSVRLVTPNLERSQRFYQDVLGLDLKRREENHATLGARNGPAFLELREDPAARSVSRTTGLYHMAVLVPSRLELARAIRRLAHTGWPIQGASDHLVSEAIYLSDPDGNGIEIYRDRPRVEWPYAGGQLQMATDPLDLDGILRELEGESEPVESGMHPDTRMGHVHLRVANIPAAEKFYREVLGFDLMVRYGHSASFVSAGGYHHHIGFNTWESSGAPPPPPGAAGLDYFTILLPDLEALEPVLTRVRAAGLEPGERGTEYLVRDPSGNGILLAARNGMKDP